MNVENKKVNFEDSRGAIRDILIGKDVDAITIITCTKDSVRGNHFHKQSIQYTYIVKGKFICATQEDGKDTEAKEVFEGDLVSHLPGEKHAFKALEDSVLLSLTKGIRQGENYEEDTFRLDTPILS